ncbi:GNAT family N-acetyltransferase [Metabacillus halosaccharovorans]|uniref:GNAT family N-acetyltransferase n=1 Tax=Metabacillus halosaccharovorans TaxID=930124 RepID=UPI00099539C6|nr:GNAT family N-acetyltransferase [Metabacillus halosaccharovorans]
MEKYRVKQINDLFRYDLNSLITRSKEEGFRFIERLVNDYKNGSNTFNNSGEALFGVFNEKEELIAIGGLNIDPFSQKQYIGRLRRFYVMKEYRRNGIGSLLIKKIINEAVKYYKILVLHTDTKQADLFYSSLGFLKEDLYPNSTHYIALKN